MKFNELKLRKQKKSTRVGRGISAGKGKTAGRGTKGQGARKSGGVRPGFEGGQMPLYMRIPKLRGFTSHRKATENVTLAQLVSLNKPTVDNDILAEAGLTTSPYVKVKVIATGEISKKLNVRLQAASKKAIEAIDNAGGSFSRVDQQKRPAKKTESK